MNPDAVSTLKCVSIRPSKTPLQPNFCDCVYRSIYIVLLPAAAESSGVHIAKMDGASRLLSLARIRAILCLGTLC
jgi:hypothetical protein